MELINSFKRAAHLLHIELEVIAVDADPAWSPACHIADYCYSVPRCNETTYIDVLIDICRKHSIDLVIPLIDTELLPLAANRERFRAYGVKILLGPNDFLKMARDKMRTISVLAHNGIRVPKTWNWEDALAKAANLPYPVIIKPISGSRSIGIRTVKCPDELLSAEIEKSEYIVQEMCDGKEYTVNCFYDRGLQSCVPHYRKLVRNGEVCFARTERIEDFTTVGRVIAAMYADLYGPICFQGFKSVNGDVAIIEVNARFGGGYPICEFSGANFAKWIIQKLAKISPDYSDYWQSGAVMLRYDAAIFLTGHENALCARLG